MSANQKRLYKNFSRTCRTQCLTSCGQLCRVDLLAPTCTRTGPVNDRQYKETDFLRPVVSSDYHPQPSIQRKNSIPYSSILPISLPEPTPSTQKPPRCSSTTPPPQWPFSVRSSQQARPPTDPTHLLSLIQARQAQPTTSTSSPSLSWRPQP
jgi:hypothetical protein